MLSKVSLFLCTLVILGLVMACSKQYTPENYTLGVISFGSGGGVTGMVTEYTLLDNGQLFKKEGPDTSYQETAKRVSRNLTKQSFHNYDFLNLADIQLQDPGNLYYFVEFKKGKNTPHRMTWGGGNVNVPANVKTYYRNLNQLVKQARFSD